MNAIRTFDVLQIGSGIVGCCTALELSSRGLSVSVIDVEHSYGCESFSRTNLFSFQCNQRGLGGNLSAWSGLCSIVGEDEWNTLRADHNLSTSYQKLISLYNRASYYGFPSYDCFASNYDDERKFHKVRVSEDLLHCARAKCHFFVDPIELISFSHGEWHIIFQNQKVIKGKVLHLAAGGLSNLSILQSIHRDAGIHLAAQKQISLHRKKVVDDLYLSRNFPEILDHIRVRKTPQLGTQSFCGFCSSDYKNLLYLVANQTSLSPSAQTLKEMLPQLSSRLSILSPSLILSMGSRLPPNPFNILRVISALTELSLNKLLSSALFKKWTRTRKARDFFYHHNTHLNEVVFSNKLSKSYPFYQLEIRRPDGYDPYSQYVDSNHFCSTIFLNVLVPKDDIINGTISKQKGLYSSGTSNLPSAQSTHPTLTALALAISTCDSIVNHVKS